MISPGFWGPADVSSKIAPYKPYALGSGGFYPCEEASRQTAEPDDQLETLALRLPGHRSVWEFGVIGVLDW